MRLLGYTRVSTASQDALLQVQALTEAGVERRDIFSDVTSGSNKAVERPGMRRLLGYAEPGDTVVVWRIDRLGRSLLDVVNTVAVLSERDVQVQSIQDKIDPATPAGRLQLHLLAVLAEYERELIVERVRAGMAAAREEGTRFGRKPPDPATVERKLSAVNKERRKGTSVREAVKVVSWSRATYYRHARAAEERNDAHGEEDT